MVEGRFGTAPHAHAQDPGATRLARLGNACRPQVLSTTGDVVAALATNAEFDRGRYGRRQCHTLFGSCRGMSACRVIKLGRCGQIGSAPMTLSKDVGSDSYAICVRQAIFGQFWDTEYLCSAKASSHIWPRGHMCSHASETEWCRFTVWRADLSSFGSNICA